MILSGCSNADLDPGAHSYYPAATHGRCARRLRKNTVRAIIVNREMKAYVEPGEREHRAMS